MNDAHRLVLPSPDPSWRDGSGRGRRAAYRAWVREHHPDRGGDPAVFEQGLQVWRRTLRQPACDDGAPDGRVADAGAPPATPVRFHRTRRPSPLAWWAARRAERARPARVR